VVSSHALPQLAESFPQRIGWVRERRGERWLALCAIALILSVTFALSATPLLAPLCLLLAGWAALRARAQFRLARVAAIGARSEALVQAALEPLTAAGWTIGHSVPWPRRGDIDHIAIAPPPGPTFVIETKTRAYTGRDLRRIRGASGLFTAAIPLLVTTSANPAHERDGVQICAVPQLEGLLRQIRRDYLSRLEILARSAPPTR
jgi:hypothetical protein